MPSDFSRIGTSDPYLDFSPETSPEELESQVQKAKAEIETLRERQSQIEKEKQRLEELSRRQEELERGREDMLEKLTRAVRILEAESEETERRLEQLQHIHKMFKVHVQELENINPRMLSSAEISKELTKGLALVGSARSDYAKVQSKFAGELNDDSSGLADLANYEEMEELENKGFLYWFKRGFAFTLPLLLFGIIGLLLVLWILSSPR